MATTDDPTSTTTTSSHPEEEDGLPSLFLSMGSETSDLSDATLQDCLARFLEALGPRDDVLLLPPDFSRVHSQAGKITRMICEQYRFIPKQQEQESTEATTTTTLSTPKIQILPALGTHAPMTLEEIQKMYGPELAQKSSDCFVVHDWRNDVVTIGHVPAEMVQKATYNTVNRPWPVQLNQTVWAKRKCLVSQPSENSNDDTNNNNRPPKKPYPLVLSIGQVVPHEVMGMSNFNKNLFVGTGGVQAINLSHFIGAVHGMERMMGRQDNPLRDILNQASTEFLHNELDLWYILTVVAQNAATSQLCIRGLYIGNDMDCYSQACQLSLQVNFTVLEKPIPRCVVYLDPDEFHSTWLGNKAIYRTRMAMADNGHLIILAPGVERFGEDDQVDALIRQYGYFGTPKSMQQLQDHSELQDNLSAVAHLIHGSSEGRFRITYCPGHLTPEEITSVGFDYQDLAEAMKRYDITTLADGWNTDEEGDFYFIRKPSLGLWTVQSRFEK